MLNNIINFFSLIAKNKIKSSLDPTDLIPVGTRDPRYVGNYQPTAITFDDLAKQLTTECAAAVGNSTPGNFCDITMTPKNVNSSFLLSPPVFFSHSDYGTEVDIIAPGQTEITRGVGSAIYNIALEANYDSGSGSPLNTVWNSQYTDLTNNGFANLESVEDRLFLPFREALDYNVGINILSTQLVMHDLSTNKYYTFEFSAWTQSNAGGGFAYTRQEIILVEAEEPCKITFSDGTVQDTAWTGCDIAMEPQTVTIGDAVVFSQNILVAPIEADVLIPGVLEILMIPGSINIWENLILGGNQLVWNANWCSNPSGFSDLINVPTRTYCNWGLPGGPSQVILYDSFSNTYWKFNFADFNSGGIFNYTREQIIISELCEITFSDGSKQNTAAGEITSSNSSISVVETIVDGFKTIDLTAIGGADVNYSNVLFVDAINGNDGTGQINNFTKPFLTIYNAIYAATANGSASATNRLLVYVRRGTYSSNYIYMGNYVDVYCEPGVFLQGSTLIRDNGQAITANFLGHARIDASATTVKPIVLTGASYMNIEFDYITCMGAVMEINIASTSNNIMLKGNYIYSGTNGAGFGSTIRGNTNLTMHLTKAFEAPHLVLQFKFFTGNALINIPNINLVAGNIYGGNFKSMIYLDASGGKVTINGNLNCKDTVYYGGISGGITCWAGSNTKLTLNGNIAGGVTHGTYLAAGAAEFTFNGDISSDLVPLVAGGASIVHVKNSLLLHKTVAAHSVVSMSTTAVVYLSDSEMYSESETALINVQHTGNKLYIKNVSAEGFNQPVGNSIIVAGAPTPIVGLFNFITNKPVDAGTVNIYATPYILEPNLNVPKFFLV